MYDPGTGRFLSRDPLLDAGAQVSYGHDYVARFARSLHLYTYCENNSTTHIDPSGLEVIIRPPLNQPTIPPWEGGGGLGMPAPTGGVGFFPTGAAGVPTIPPGVWTCPGSGRDLGTRQTPGPGIAFQQTFCGDCSETCTISVFAYRCFNDSVQQGDSRNPGNFYTRLHARIDHKNRRCGDKVLPDTTFHIDGGPLYPGRLVNPAGRLSDAVTNYVKGLMSCKDFSMADMLDAAAKVPPPEFIPSTSRQ